MLGRTNLWLSRFCKEAPTRESANSWCVEPLEPRILLANIAAVDAYLVDGSGQNQINEVVVGQEIALRIDWTTSNLPSDIPNYQVEFVVDGVPLRSSPINAGAGQTFGNYSWYRLGWYATPGQQTATITVDVDDVVAETDETDNSISFNFTPVTAAFPQPMIWPLETAPQSESFWTNYNDVDPTGGLADYTGGTATYNGHNAIDAGPVNFVEQDEGVDIYAALDGVVTAIHDGEFDRHTFGTGAPANYVILDHGGGWESWYYHMRRDSVQVVVGQNVQQEDKLGLVGSSGNSTGSHIHFELRYLGLPVETYYDPATYWVTPVDYVGDNVYLIDSGITNYHPGNHFWEGPSDSDVFHQQSGIRTYARGYFSGLRTGDLLEFSWFRPNGSLYGNGSFHAPQNYSSSGWFWSFTLPSSPDLGTWRVDYRVNGQLLGQEFFDISTAGIPEIRVDDSVGQIVLDGRFTPYDFGVVEVGGGSPTKTFTVVNHGYDTLIVDSLSLPTGFTLTEGLASSIAPGASDDFTVALDTTSGGYFAGEVRVRSNDEDESVYNFAVEGMVESVSTENLIVGIGALEFAEGDQLVANVRRLGNLSSPLTVNLASSHPADVSLPSTLSFAPGESYVQFFIEALNDRIVEWAEQVTVTAFASGYYHAMKTVDVLGYTPSTADAKVAVASPAPANDNDQSIAVALYDGILTRGELISVDSFGGGEFPLKGGPLPSSPSTFPAHGALGFTLEPSNVKWIENSRSRSKMSIEPSVTASQERKDASIGVNLGGNERRQSQRSAIDELTHGVQLDWLFGHEHPLRSAMPPVPVKRSS